MSESQTTSWRDRLRPLLPDLIRWACSLAALWIGVGLLWMIENHG